MTRLPKKYFKSISDYVKAYYTAYGAQRAQKLYDAVKTVTKDFTRTDPVYVRIGEDGEPEIHCTVTQADGSSWFANMDLGKSTLCVHNGRILTTVTNMLSKASFKRLIVDSLENITDFSYFNEHHPDNSTIESIDILNEKIGSGTLGYYFNRFAFSYMSKLSVIPKFDMSNFTDATLMFLNLPSVTSFLPYGAVSSFDISLTGLKHDAILEVFSNLGTVDATAGITLTLGSYKLALMSDEEKAIATGKGWVLA